ncbi:MAG: hypothetical protein IT449_16705 [Phycisphaerales bacterium]|nr:hypothetical protein [Phycisphaerales bacterium]
MARSFAIARPLCVAASLTLFAAASALHAQLPGFEIVQITSDSPDDSGSQLNNCGQVVFRKRIGESWSTSEIFLYDNGKVFRLTNDNNRDVHPTIDDAGKILWLRGIGNAGVTQIMVYEHGEVSVFRENAEGVSDPVGNASGAVAWSEFYDRGCWSIDGDVHLSDGMGERRISDGAKSNQSPHLNSTQKLVWTRYDFCPNPWISSIMLHNGSGVMELTQGQIQPQLPEMNDSLQTAFWSRTEQGGDLVQLWEDGVIHTIFEGGGPPHINNLGEVQFTDGGYTFLYRSGDIIQVTFEYAKHGGKDLNDFTEMSMEAGKGFQSDVFMMRRSRTGDADLNLRVDTLDYKRLNDCLRGPEWLERNRESPTDTLCECRFVDLDEDNDVDLKDAATLFNAFSGE